MNKISYRSETPKKQKVYDGPMIFDGEESNTDNAGRNGFNLTEMGYYSFGQPPEEKEVKKIHDSEDIDIDETIDLLVELGDEMDKDGKEAYANFLDYILFKYAETKESTQSDPFNELMIRISNSDSLNSNDLLKKITKLYSRAILVEMNKGASIEEAKNIAYKKIVIIAEQHLFSDQNLIPMKTAQYLVQNPKYVAESIKNVIQ